MLSLPEKAGLPLLKKTIPLAARNRSEIKFGPNHLIATGRVFGHRRG